MAKWLRNKFALWTAITYIAAVLFLGVFSLGAAFLASSAISGLFYTFILPTIILALFINFFIGYGIGLLLEKVWRKLK